MKTHDFIEKSIGCKVYITGDGDLGMSGRLRNLIYNKTELTIVKLTKGGMAYLIDNYGNYYSVPPRNVREINNDNNN